MYCAPTRFFGREYSSEVLLSVVVPIGRMAGQLENLLSWILDIQDYPAQVILVVDEKGDGTYLELVNELEQKAINRPLIVINAICNGPGFARNLGTREASGEWIVYWDSDDKPNVKETFNAIKSSKMTCDVIICRYEVLDDQGMISSPTLSLNEVAFNPGIWRFIFSRKTFLESEFPDLRLAEDQVFIIKSRVFSKEIAFHNEVTYQYVRGGANQLTRSKNNFSDLLEALSMMSELDSIQIDKKDLEKTFLRLMILRVSLTSIKNNALGTIKHLMANPRTLTNIFQSLPLIMTSRFTK